MKTTFKIDPQITHILGEGYKSSEKAVKELVDNAWDADASRVDITLPDYMKVHDPIIIRDNGRGMTPIQMQDGYLAVASDKRKRQGEKTELFKRQVKGRKGIGKFAGLLVANEMKVESRAQGKLSTLSLNKSTLLHSTCGFEEIELPFAVSACSPKEEGTTITLSDLNQKLAYPSVETLSNLLLLEYGHTNDFDIVINGQTLEVEHLTGQSSSQELPVAAHTGSAPILKLTLADKAIKQPGIVLKVLGKVIGKPSFFGLDEDEEVPRKLLNQLFGEIHADYLADVVTSGGDAFIENSHEYQELYTLVRSSLKVQLYGKFTQEINLAKARLQLTIDRGLSRLPENRREYARRAIDKILEKFYAEKDDKKEVIISVLLDALEKDEYYLILQKIDDARGHEVMAFAEALSEFGFLQLSQIGRQANQRLRILDDLENLIFNDKTLEKEVHQALASNLWVFGNEYTLLSSDTALKRMVRELYGESFDDAERELKRPDLFLGKRYQGKNLLIEFKRPNCTIKREHISQAEQYRDDLRSRAGDMDVIIIGHSVDPKIDLNSLPAGVLVLSYIQVISQARSELEWLLKGTSGV